MKKVSVIAVAIAFCLSYSNLFAANATAGDEKGKPWPVNSYSSESLKCTAPGENCNLVVTTNVTVSAHPLINNAYIVKIEFVELVSIFNNIATTRYEHDVLTFKFPEGFKLKILQCEEFPQVEGAILDLSNIETNGTDFLTLQIIVATNGQ